MVVKDKESGNLRLPHHIDEVTGMYRGKQIFTPKVKKVHESKVKGPSTEPTTKPTHEHAHEEHANAEAKSSKGIFGKIATGGRPKREAVSEAEYNNPHNLLLYHHTNVHWCGGILRVQLFPWRTDI